MAPKRPVRLVQSEVWLGRTEFEDLIRQRGPETAEAPRCLGSGTRAIEVRPFNGRSPRVPAVAPLFSPFPVIADDDGLIRLDDLEPAATEAPNRPSPARSRRFPRWAAAGVLGLVVTGGAVSVPLLTSHGRAARVTASNAAPANPVAAAPAPATRDDRSDEPVAAGSPAAVAAPNPPAEVTVKSAPASVPASRTARSDGTTTRPKRSDSAPTPPPANQVALDEAYRWWSQAAAYGAKNPRWTHFGSESPPWP